MFIVFKSALTSIALLLSLSNSANAFAEKLDGSFAILIPNVHFQNPVRLLHPYYDYWHTKGPATQKAAQKVFNQHFVNPKFCADNNTPDVVLSLEPQLFFNAQMNVFHAQMTAKVYNSGISPILTIKSEAQEFGLLHSNADFYIDKAYLKVMNSVVKELEKDPIFLSALKSTQKTITTDLCGTLNVLAPTTLFF